MSEPIHPPPTPPPAPSAPARPWRRVLGWLGLALVVCGALVGAYRQWIYHPVIFGLRDDFVHAVPVQQTPEGVASLSAEACGQCHSEIYAEWRTSIHAQAYTDPYYQAYWKKDGNIWICANCHTPLANQQPLLITGLENGRIDRPITAPNPDFDPALQQEGITCAACHVRDGIIYGPYGDSDAPHPTAYDPKYRSTEICYWCHQVPSGPFQFYNGGPCATFFEFEDGPYAAQGYTCQTCHMPAARRPAADGGPMRDTRRHLWRGGHSPSMLQRALQVRLSTTEDGWKTGDRVQFQLRLTNGGAGHKIPTGDPDRHFTVTFEERDARGDLVHRQRHKIARWIIWKPIIIEVYGNRIPPLGHRDYRYSLNARPGHTLTVTVRYHILTAAAKRMLIEKYDLPATEPDQFLLFQRVIELGSGGLDPVVLGTGPMALENAENHRCGAPHPA